MSSYRMDMVHGYLDVVDEYAHVNLFHSHRVDHSTGTLIFYLKEHKKKKRSLVYFKQVLINIDAEYKKK